MAIKIEKYFNEEIKLIPINIDLHYSTPNNRTSFFITIIQKILESLNRQKLYNFSMNNFFIPKVSENEFDLDLVLKVLQKLENICLSHWVNCKVIFLIDEFEYLETKDFAEDLFSNLRVMISNHPIRNFISLIVFGDKYLYEMTDIKGSPLDNLMTVIPLGILEFDAAIEMASTPLKGKLSSAIIEEICALSGYHPYMIKYIMRDIWKKHQKGNITPGDIHLSSQSLISQSNVFRYWYKELNELDKNIYLEFTKKVYGEHVNLSMSNLINIFKNHYIEDSVNKLFYHGFISKDSNNNFRIVANLFMDWFLNIFQSQTSKIDSFKRKDERKNIMNILELITTSTVPTIIKFGLDQLDKLINRKFEKDDKNIEQLKKSLEPYITLKEIKDSDLEYLKEDIILLFNKIEQNDKHMISNENFRRWTESNLEDEELAILVKNELEFIINKAFELNIRNKRRREIEDIADSLELNLKRLEKARRDYRISGTYKNEEEVEERELILKRTIREARALIEKY